MEVVGGIRPFLWSMSLDSSKKTPFLKALSSNDQNKLIDLHDAALHFIISLRLLIAVLMAKDPASAWLLTEANPFNW